jgi:Tfp pilus assembly protein PilF
LALLVTLACVPVAVRAAGPATFGEQMAFGVDMARKGLWREALFRFQQAGRMQPGNVRATNNLAVAYEAVGLFDKALETYRSGLEVSPNDSELRRNYSQFLELYQSFESEEEDDAPAAEAPAEGETAPVDEANEGEPEGTDR